MKAKELKQELMEVRTNSKATLKDIKVVIKAVETGDYTKARKTKLYLDKGLEYCSLLELIEKKRRNKQKDMTIEETNQALHDALMTEFFKEGKND